MELWCPAVILCMAPWVPSFAMPRDVPAQHCSDAWRCSSSPIWSCHTGASTGNPIIAAVEMMSAQNCRGIVTTLFLSVLVLLLFGSWQSSASVLLCHFWWEEWHVHSCCVLCSKLDPYRMQASLQSLYLSLSELRLRSVQFRVSWLIAVYK